MLEIIEALKDQRLENEKQQVQIDEQREQIKQLVKLMDIKSIHEKVFEENEFSTKEYFYLRTGQRRYYPASFCAASGYLFLHTDLRWQAGGYETDDFNEVK